MSYKSGICIKRPAVGKMPSRWNVAVNKFFLLRKYFFEGYISAGKEAYNIYLNANGRSISINGYVGAMSAKEIEEHFLILEK